tara:strand:+ start:6566 stop:7285 length:720 start_codon:yes stop_codon:yes gene_type:complete
MQQPYNILPKKTADRIAKTFYYNKKGEVRWWDGKQLKNKDKIKEANKKYRAANKEKIKEDNKKYWCKYYKKYNECLNEKIREYRANPSNKKLINKRRRARAAWRYKNDPDYRLTRLLRGRFWKALKSKNIKKNSHVLELTSCSIDFLRKYLSKQFEEGMTWGNQGQWHIDHRKPCASFDLSNEEDQRKCFHYTNLQPLWGKENMEKSANFNEATFEYTWTTAEQGWVLRGQRSKVENDF